MKTTSNFGFKKPDGNDVVNIEDLNYNTDIVDKKLKEIESKASNIEVPVKSVNGKTGAVALNANDIRTSGSGSIQQVLDYSMSQLEHIKSDVENIDLSAEKVNLNSSNLKSKTVKEGMEELFTFADNYKKSVANVVGSPVLATDTAKQVKSKIQGLKNTFASNLSSKQVSANGTEGLNSLVEKVNRISVAIPFRTIKYGFNNNFKYGVIWFVNNGDLLIHTNNSNKYCTLYKRKGDCYYYLKEIKAVDAEDCIKIDYYNKKYYMHLNSEIWIDDFNGNNIKIMKMPYPVRGQRLVQVFLYNNKIYTIWGKEYSNNDDNGASIAIYDINGLLLKTIDINNKVPNNHIKGSWFFTNYNFYNLNLEDCGRASIIRYDMNMNKIGEGKTDFIFKTNTFYIDDNQDIIIGINIDGDVYDDDGIQPVCVRGF
ncbi:hypothetical protein [Clostridium rectalis]|uniref:hypothetical protein n=1 Tax=Clostridium rectalis TaxID=2040295 RepID=UPI000F630B18|nr:hypothetical protein [Clostridium rectalis]